MKKIFFFILALAFQLSKSNTTQAQDSTQDAKLRFSLITCDAGEDIYTIWGHTAIRVIDSVNHTDIVYNYGSFDFNTPNFIAKFIKGNLKYFISADTYQNFLYEYQYFERDVHEQVLNISTSEKIKWYQDLQTNMVGDNRFYLYNFITDNCTTRIKDGIFKHTTINDSLIDVPNFREQIVSSAYKAGQVWIGFGIDLLLGAVSDRKPNAFEQAFLPTLLFNRVANNPALVAQTNHIKYQIKPAEKASSPIYVLIAILILYILAANWNARPAVILSKAIDILLLITFGIGGLLVLYMSQFSMHTACHENYNILWLHPIYLIALVTYFVSRKLTGYLGWIFFSIIIAFMLGNYFIPQQFSIEVILVICIALILSIRLIKRGRDARFQ
jgi:hypothetical protein